MSAKRVRATKDGCGTSRQRAQGGGKAVRMVRACTYVYVIPCSVVVGYIVLGIGGVYCMLFCCVSTTAWASADVYILFRPSRAHAKRSAERAKCCLHSLRRSLPPMYGCREDVGAQLPLLTGRIGRGVGKGRPACSLNNASESE